MADSLTKNGQEQMRAHSFLSLGPCKQDCKSILRPHVSLRQRAAVFKDQRDEVVEV